MMLLTLAKTMASTTLPTPHHDQSIVPSDKSIVGAAAMSSPNFRQPSPSSLSSSPSHSSKSSSFGSLSFHDCHSPISNSTPATPLHPQGGVPFSWEQIPGIPKKSVSDNRRSSTRSLLPLPPPAGTPCSAALASPRKLSSFRNDPFFAALVTCSKDDRHGDEKSSNKVTRSISDRFGFISFYGSCKTTCAVSESIAYFPRSRNYDNHHHLINRQSRR